MRRPQADVIRLDKSKPLSPCPSRVTAYLGFAQPTTIPCADVAGHQGPHWYRIRWTDSGWTDSAVTHG